MKTIFYIILFGLSSVQSYAQKKIETDSTSMSVIRLDPENAIGAAASDIFENVSYIPMETTVQSTFGSIDQLEVVNDYFIILDHNTNSILIFTKEGKFHAKIKGTSYIPIYSFTVDRTKGHIVFSADNFATISYFDFNGNLVRKTENKDPKSKALFNFNFYFLGKDRIVSYDQYRDFDTKSKYYTNFSRSLIRLLNSKGEVLSIGLTYSDQERKIDVLNTGDARALTRSGHDDKLFFSKPYHYDIYTISPDHIKLSYKLIFPLKSTLPPDFTSNRSFDTKRGIFLKQNRKLIYSLSNIYTIGSNLILKTNSYETSKLNTLIYSLSSGRLIAYKHIIPDASSSFLPLYDDTGSNFDNVGLAFCDGENLYTSISSLRMFQTRDENKKMDIHYNGSLQTFFNTQNKNANPVIVQLKLKTNF